MYMYLQIHLIIYIQYVQLSVCQSQFNTAIWKIKCILATATHFYRLVDCAQHTSNPVQWYALQSLAGFYHFSITFQIQLFRDWQETVKGKDPKSAFLSSNPNFPTY